MDHRISIMDHGYLMRKLFIIHQVKTWFGINGNRYDFVLSRRISDVHYDDTLKPRLLIDYFTTVHLIRHHIL